MKKIFIATFLISISITLINCSPNNEAKEVGKTVNKNNDELVIEESNININGVNHYIKKIGTGEPLIVLHGGPGMFHNHLEQNFNSIAKKYQVIFYDQRGCGKTEFPKDTTTISTDNFVEDLEAIRLELGLEKINLAGHSWGSTLALNYAKKYNENLKKLILIAPGPANSDLFVETFKNMQQKRSEEDMIKLVDIMGSKAFDDRDSETFKEAIMIGDKVNLVNQATINELYKNTSFTKETANKLLTVNSIMEKNFFNYNTLEGLNIINCPTLIILGELDNVPFESAQLLHESIKDSEIKVLSKTGHYPFFESPKEFNYSVKSFLKKNN